MTTDAAIYIPITIPIPFIPIPITIANIANVRLSQCMAVQEQLLADLMGVVGG